MIRKEKVIWSSLLTSWLLFERGSSLMHPLYCLFSSSSGPPGEGVWERLPAAGLLSGGDPQEGPTDGGGRGGPTPAQRGA